MRAIAVNVGDRFGALVVIALHARRKRNGRRRVRCRCDCTREVLAEPKDLCHGNTKSCGCLRRRKGSDHPLWRHGFKPATSPEYRAWTDMISRCYNPNVRNYSDYGGRGIQVCAAWRDDFLTFLTDVSTRPSPQHSLDRYPDVNGHYEPRNVRWATRTEQARNKRTSRLITFDGRTQCLCAWADQVGVSEATLRYRLDHWPLGRALQVKL